MSGEWRFQAGWGGGAFRIGPVPRLPDGPGGAR